MQDTESVKTPPAGLKQLSRPSSRRGKIDAGTGEISWDIVVLPGDGIGPEVIGAARIRSAVETVLADPTNCTPDAGGRLPTRQKTEMIMEQL